MQQDDPHQLQQPLMFLGVTLAVVMFVLPLTFQLPLLDPDEGLHASIAQEMVERGDWVVPKLVGQPFLDKPILYFWLQATSLKIFGPCEMAIRLPGLMLGLLGAVTTGLLGWRLFNRATGWIAGILYATTILPTAMAQIASHDVALIPWINLALLTLWESDHAASRRVRTWCVIACGATLGLAILTKGLFGIAVVGLAYGGYLMLARQVRVVHLVRAAAMLTIAILVASPWYYLIEMRQPGYLRYFFLERHLLGLTTSSQRHGDAPWWYYIPILLGGGLPWIGYLPIVVQEGLAHRKTTPEQASQSASPLLWVWMIGWTLLMTLAGSKLATYIWPVFPAMSILAATLWQRRIDNTLSESAAISLNRTFTSSSWCGPLVLPLAMFVVQKAYKIQFGWPVWGIVFLAAVATMLPIIPWRARHWTTSLAAASLSLAMQFVIVMAFALPVVGGRLTAYPLAEYFNRQDYVPARVFVADERIGSLVFYLTPELRASLQVGQLMPFVVEEPAALRPGDVLAVPKHVQRQLSAELHLDGLAYKSAGRYRIYTIPPEEEQP